MARPRRDPLTDYSFDRGEQLLQEVVDEILLSEDGADEERIDPDSSR